ncbi:MAG: hypothetical protein OIF57_06390 [Marinobacterium sp.]|nr:hypothetical protein [Marinobacterium sp.]
MANVILTSTDTSYTVASGNNVDLTGLAGVQTITIQDGASANLIGAFDGDTIVMSGNAANYTMSASGATVTLTNSITGAVITLPAKPDATTLQFADGARDLAIDLSGSAPEIKLGTDTVTDTPTAPTGDAGGVDVNYSVVPSSSSVTEGTEVTFTVTASAAVDQDVVLNYQLMGADVAGGTADPASDLGRITGSVTIPAGSTSAVITLTPTNDGTTEGFEGFKLALLDTNFTTVATSSNVAIADGVESGKTFALTTDVDNLPGTAGDDVFTAVLVDDDLPGNTLNPGDVINGGDGKDELNLSITGDLGDDLDIGAIQTQSVERLEISNYDQSSDDHTMDAALMNGITEVALNGSSSSGDVNIDNLSQMVAAEMRNGEGSLDLDFISSVSSGDDDAITLTVSNQSSGQFDVDAIERITVHTELADSTLNEVKSNTLKSLTFTGDRNIKVNEDVEFGGSTGSIDASALTGKLDVSVGLGGVDVTIIGGSNDDTFLLQGTPETGDTVDGGDGDDLISIQGLTSALSLENLAISNVEQLKVEAASTDHLEVDLASSALSTVRAVEAGNAKNVTLENLAAGTDVVIQQVQSGNNMGGVELVLADATGSADVLDVSVELDAGTTGVESIAGVTAAGVETLNLNSTVLANSGALTGSDVNKLEALTLDAATTLNLTGDALLTLKSITAANLTTIDGSALTAGVDIEVVDNDVTLTGGSGDDFIRMGSALTIDDVIDGGDESAANDSVGDTLYATVDGLGTTTTAAALQVSDVERIVLETDNNASVIDLTADAELKLINVDGDQNVTLTGLAAGAEVGLGSSDLGVDADEYSGTLSVALADETGSADELTVNLANTSTNNDVDAALVTADTLEKVTVNASDDGSNNNAKLDVSAVASATLAITGGESTQQVVLDDSGIKLSATTTLLDASEFDGILTATTSDTATAVKLKGGVVHGVSSGAGDDTFTVSSVDDNMAYDVDGGAGTDVLNLGLGAGTFTDTNIENFETINYTVDAGKDADVATASGKGINDSDATKVTVAGGDSSATFKMGSATAIGAGDGSQATGLTTFDMSGFAGDTQIVFGDGVLDSSLTVTGGSGTDTVMAGYDDAGTHAVKVADVETLLLTVDGDGTGSETHNIDAASLTGGNVLRLAAGNANTVDNTVNVQNLAAGVAVGLGWEAATGDLGYSAVSFLGESTLNVGLATHSGTADALTVELNSVDADGGVVTVEAAGVEALTLDVADSVGVELDLSGVAATAGSNLTVTLEGGSAGVNINSLSDSVSTIDTSAGSVALILTGRGAGPLTVTASDADDALLMTHKDDALDAGGSDTRGDTLVVEYTAVVGGMAVDLSATGDQIQTFNGGANAAVQTGFQHADLSGYQGNGAEITAHADGSRIFGTSSVDNIILGAGADTVVFAASAAANGTDSIANFTAGATTADVLDFGHFISVVNTTQVGDGTDETLIAATDTVVTIDNSSADIAGKDYGNADFAELFGATGGNAAFLDEANGTAGANSKNVVIIRGQDETQIYYVENDSDAAIVAGEVTLVGVLSGTTGAMTADNVEGISTWA